MHNKYPTLLILFLGAIILLSTFTISQSNLGIDNPNLPKIESKPGTTIISNTNYSSVNVNNSQYLQGYTPLTLPISTAANLLFGPWAYNMTQPFTDWLALDLFVPYTGATKNVNLNNHNLTLGGNNNYSGTIGMERSSDLLGNGGGLTIDAGGGALGFNNREGGNLTLKSGVSTGTQSSSIRFFTSSSQGNSPFDNPSTERVVIDGNGNMFVLTGNFTAPNICYSNGTNCISSSYNATYNIWAYNQTIPANTYTESRTNYSYNIYSLDTDPSLLALYRMEKGNGTFFADETGLNNATCTSCPAYTTQGSVFGAYTFDGRANMLTSRISATASMNTTNLTFSLWFKRSGSEASQQILISPQNQPLMLGISGNAIMVWPDASDLPALSFAYTLNVNQWYYVTFQPTYYYNASGDAVSNTTVYINGAYAGSAYGPAHAWHNQNNVTNIGAYTAGSKWFNGSIDDIRIYNRTLTLTEIQTIYTTSKYSPKALNAWTESPAYETISLMNASWLWTFNATYDAATGGLVNGLVAWYGFDNWSWAGENSTRVIDYSGNNNNGTNNGATPTSGVIGGAYSFNGSGAYINLGNTLTANASTQTAWIYPTTYYNTPQVISSQNAIGNIYLRVHTNGQLVCGNSNFTNQFENQVGPANIIPLNKWSFVACTVDNFGNSQGYVNSNNYTINNLGVNYINAKLLKIGYEVASGRYYNGSIDDVRIYNRSLSQTEITALYNQGAQKYNNQYDLSYQFAQSTRTTLSGYVPYTGATANLSLGSGNNISLGTQITFGNGGYMKDNGTAVIIGHS